MSSLPALLSIYLVSQVLQFLKKSPITISWFAVKILLLVCISLQTLLGVNNYLITAVTLSKVQHVTVSLAYAWLEPCWKILFHCPPPRPNLFRDEMEYLWIFLLFFFKNNTRAVLPRIDNQIIRTFLQYRKPGFIFNASFSHQNWNMNLLLLRLVPDPQTIDFYEGFIFCLALSMVSVEKYSKLWFSGLICWI